MDNKKIENSEEKTDRIIKKLIACFLVIVVFTIAFLGGYYTYYFTMSKDIKTYKWVMDTINKYYYEELDDNDLLNTAMGAISDEMLDAYSSYYTKEEYALILSQREGNKVGIGCSFGYDSNGKPTTTIKRVSGNSPCEKAGIKVGENIVAIGKDVNSLVVLNNDYKNLSKELAKYKEDENFVIKTSADKQEKIYTLAKTFYNEGFVFYKTKEGNYSFTKENNDIVFKENEFDTEIIPNIDDKTAYILLTSFNGNASEQFMIALNKFKEGKKTKLILDLRNNGGGYMDILQEIAGSLVYKADTKLVCAKAEYKDGKKTDYPILKSNYKTYNYEKIVVLGNEGTASASECLIGAMIDYGTLLRENLIVSGYNGAEGRTFGKGIMQSTFTNKFSSNALKLTVAKILWPLSDTCIHGIGINGTTIQANTSKDIIGVKDDFELLAAISKMQ